jgi:hypothetical protein
MTRSMRSSITVAMLYTPPRRSYSDGAWSGCIGPPHCLRSDPVASSACYGPNPNRVLWPLMIESTFTVVRVARHVLLA